MLLITLQLSAAAACCQRKWLLLCLVTCNMVLQSHHVGSTDVLPDNGCLMCYMVASHAQSASVPAA
jgi:hypothetical protein